MNGKHQPRVDRTAMSLLSLLQDTADHRLSESERQSRREEVNRTLGEMGNEAIDATLTSLYRIAESKARRNARRLTQQPAARHEGWFALLRRVLTLSKRRSHS